jgi:hypothetical protein
LQSLGTATSEHTPVVPSQHATGAVHGFGWQTPLAWNVLVEAEQPCCAMAVHPPVEVLQQAPGAGQTLGEHEVPLPR